MRSPLPHQVPILEYARTHPKAALFVDKRLGKTYCACRWAEYHNARRCLVLAPTSAIPGWLDELETDGDLGWDLSIPQNFREWEKYGGDVTGRFFIVNPQALFRAKRLDGGDLPTPKSVALYPWDAVIYDETVTIKNPSSQINKIAHACLGKIPLRCGLSGEFAPEGPTDVFEQMRWIFGDFMGHVNFWEWRKEFFQELGYDWYPKKGVLSDIKNYIMQKAFVLTRQAAGLKDVSMQERRYCDLPPKTRKAYDHAEIYFEVPAAETWAEPGEQCEGVVHGRNIRFTSYVPVVRNWLCQMAGGYPKEFPDLHSDHKLRLLWEVLRERPKDQAVVSFRHNAEIDAADAFLRAKGVTTVVLRGAMTVPDRRQRCHDFRDGKYQYALKQAKVHFGMDLSSADWMVRYSLPDAYNDISQDRDRIVNPNKKRSLLYTDLVVKDTVDVDLTTAAPIKTVDARFFMTKLVQSFSERVTRKRKEAGL
jgi:hypothetical protein